MAGLHMVHAVRVRRAATSIEPGFMDGVLAQDSQPPNCSPFTQKAPMLYRLKSQATTGLTLLQADAETVLRLLGKSSGAQGVITVEQLPEAIALLEAAARVHHDSSGINVTEAGQDCEDDRDPSVSLAQRLAPVLNMLREAHQAQTPVVWGV